MGGVPPSRGVQKEGPRAEEDVRMPNKTLKPTKYRRLSFRVEAVEKAIFAIMPLIKSNSGAH